MTSNDQIAAMHKPAVVSAEEWQKNWAEMLVKEKERTRARDALAAARRRMLRLAVGKEYMFEGPQGKVPLALGSIPRMMRRFIAQRKAYDVSIDIESLRDTSLCCNFIGIDPCLSRN